MQYSPKLKKAMEQIEAILKENDIAGVVVLHTPQHSEYLHHLKTSYSCAKVTTNGIKVKLDIASLGKEKAQFIAAQTFNMMHHLTENLVRIAPGYLECYAALKKEWHGEVSKGGSHSSTEEQNN